MRRLIIDTATSACSVALFDGEKLCDAHYLEIGRGHVERLVPLIAQLPEKGRAESIHVNVGPGSFTGIRVGISAARALALAWQAQCHGYGCLSLIAAMAWRGDSAVDVVMTGGHGEYFFQPFDAQGDAAAAVQSLPPEHAAQASRAPLVAGDAAQNLVALRGQGEALPLLPDARSWSLISRLPSMPASAFYGRGPDAKLPSSKAT